MTIKLMIAKLERIESLINEICLIKTELSEKQAEKQELTEQEAAQLQLIKHLANIYFG